MSITEKLNNLIKANNDNLYNIIKTHFDKNIEALERREIENNNKIKELKNIISLQKYLINRSDDEKEKIELEIKQRKERQQIKEAEERINAINQCKQNLSNEFALCINNSFKEFNEIEKSWKNQLKKIGIEKHKKDFIYLFQKLFGYENIEQKIMSKFIEIIENTYKKKELKKMNFMVIGPSGVGKSTLINALLQEDLAEEGCGGVCTTKIERYENKNFPFINFFDSIGAELGKEYTLEDVQNDTLKLITKQLNNPDPNEHIHCIIYCLTFNRVFPDELKIILKIREKYNGKKLPIVIAYTMGNNNNKIQAAKKRINEILNKFGESLSEDIFDCFKISFLKLYAKEEEIEVNDKKSIQKCFGLSDLISICYKKGEQSYKIALENSLIRIAQDGLQNYIEKIANEYKDDERLYSYLEEKFEQNFTNFISYIFEIITNVSKYGNIQSDNKNENKNKILLKNNLNNNSKNEIDTFIRNYKNEILTIMKKNYNNFIEEESNKIYVHILEIFNSMNIFQNKNLQGAMKSKEQIKSETIGAFKNGIEEIAKENFLRNSSIVLFKDIIEVFKDEMKKKIIKFVDGLNNNNEIKKTFKSLGILESKNSIKLWTEFEQYINSLKKIEKLSELKANNSK